MQRKDFKHLFPFGRAEGGADKKKVNPFILWGIVLAIALLAGSSLFGSGRKDGSAQPETSAREEEAVQTAEEYIAQEEKRLAQTLSLVRGAGRVSVMASVEDSGEKVLASDSKSRTEEQTERDGSSSSGNEREETTVLTGQSVEQAPFVVREKRPRLSGVVVIAEGASDEAVRLELYEAVKALYGVAPHRIKITAAEREGKE